MKINKNLVIITIVAILMNTLSLNISAKTNLDPINVNYLGHGEFEINTSNNITRDSSQTNYIKKIIDTIYKIENGKSKYGFDTLLKVSNGNLMAVGELTLNINNIEDIYGYNEL